MPTVIIPDEQFIDWARQLTPAEKQRLLRVLIPEMDRFEALVDYGSERIHAVCAARGLDWDRLGADERERLLDEILHEK